MEKKEPHTESVFNLTKSILNATENEIKDISAQVITNVENTGQGLYPNILFHFTNNFKHLKGILEHTFKPSYARERIEGLRPKNAVRLFHVPMVSFCDIRLSELGKHMESYGAYGIGLTKDWANKNGLNPVMYLNKYAPVTGSYLTALTNVLKNAYAANVRAHDNEYLNIHNEFSELLKYMKNYEGTLERRSSKKKIENYRFANEREWRFVPLCDDSNLGLVPETEMKIKGKKKMMNSHISDFRLSFSPQDIKYLIVNNDNEILQLIEHLSDVKSKFSPEDVSKLSSRILTADQIKQDF